jgi:hypothetical protein
MNMLKHLVLDEPHRTTTSFSIGPHKIPAPCFMPEIKGDEDIEVLLKYSNALETNTPIIVPAYRWLSMISNPRFRLSDIFKISISELIKNRPLIFYEPPELFRYTLSTNLITYGLKGDRQKARIFNALLKKGDTANALRHLPEFFRPFASRQIKSIYKDKKFEIPNDIRETKDVRSGWLDKQIVDSYGAHMAEIINDAMKMPFASVIPTVPPLLKSSERTIFERILSTNIYTSLLCKKMSKGRSNPVKPYFHLYIDSSILETKDQNFALNILENGIERHDFCGVALTLVGYESMATKGKFNKIESFITDIVNISHSCGLPVLLPRSGWYGLYFADHGIQAFGDLMNGKPKYIRGGGIQDENDKYGKTPLIDDCMDLNYSDVKQYLKKHGEFPKVANLPFRPDLGELSNHKKYRINFGKPMRLVHIEESRRIRQGQIDDVRNPARRYFEKSEHPMLKNI